MGVDHQAWKTPADERVIAYLDQSVRRGRVAHSYLIGGPPGVGVQALAEELAQAVLCEFQERPCGRCRHCTRIAAGTHADYSVLVPVGPSMTIGIDEIRELKTASSLEPYEGRARVAVIDGAETMTPHAYNALLKLLEEPPDKVVIVMTTEDEGSIPETIRSRCQILRLRPLAFDRVEEALVAEGVDRSAAGKIAHMSAGRIGLARVMVDDNSLVEDRAEAFENLVELVGMETDERLRLAGRMADGFHRDRETLLKRLGLWEALWRDILLRESGIAPANLDTGHEAPNLDSVGVARARQGVDSIQSAIHALQRNGNPRLVMESLVLAAPSLPRR